MLGKDFDEHMERLCEVFDRLRSAGLKLKPKKCVLFQKQVEFLGNVVSEHGIETQESKIEVVRD